MKCWLRTATQTPCGSLAREPYFVKGASYGDLHYRQHHKVMATSITGDIHKATTWSIALSVLMIAAGVMAIFSPAIAGVAVTVFFGWLLIFSGILHLAYAWQAGRAGAVIWEILVGTLRRHRLLSARTASRRPGVADAGAGDLPRHGGCPGVHPVVPAAADARAAGGCCSTAS